MTRPGRRPAQLPAATLMTGDVVRRAGKWRTVSRVTAGQGLFAGLLELHTEGPYTRPWPVEVDQLVSALLEPEDERAVAS